MYSTNQSKLTTLLKTIPLPRTQTPFLALSSDLTSFDLKFNLVLELGSHFHLNHDCLIDIYLTLFLMLTLGLNSGLLHCRQILYCLSHCTQAETETSLHPKPDHDSGSDIHLAMDSHLADTTDTLITS